MESFLIHFGIFDLGVIATIGFIVFVRSLRKTKLNQDNSYVAPKKH